MSEIPYTMPQSPRNETEPNHEILSTNSNPEAPPALPRGLPMISPEPNAERAMLEGAVTEFREQRSAIVSKQPQSSQSSKDIVSLAVEAIHQVAENNIAMVEKLKSEIEMLKYDLNNAETHLRAQANATLTLEGKLADQRSLMMRMQGRINQLEHEAQIAQQEANTAWEAAEVANSQRRQALESALQSQRDLVQVQLYVTLSRQGASRHNLPDQS